MGVIKWYKRDPQAALQGMMALTLEERGAYNTVLDLIYSTDDKLVDDDRFLAGWMRCDLRVWKRIKARLIEAGKLTVSGGLLRNLRATSEVDEALHRHASVSELNRSKGIKSGAVRKKINEIDEQKPEPKLNTTTTTTRIEEVRTPLTPQGGDGEAKRAQHSGDIAEAVSEWNTLASELSLPVVQKLTDNRRKKLAARLKDCGGMDGWRAAMTKIRGSPLCRGEVSDWRADFDFVLQESSFVKLMEGKYDGSRQQKARPQQGSLRDSFAIADAVIDEAMRRNGSGEERGEEDFGGLPGLWESPA